MMNEENKVMNALVNLQVCPKCPGEACCAECSYVGTEACYESLTRDSMAVLYKHFSDQAPVCNITEPDYEGYVSDLLREIGIPAHVKGYRFASHAIILAVISADYIDSITSCLYPAVARAFDTTPSRVERAIRHAVELAWNRGDLDVLFKYFGNTVDYHKGKPTNSEFIATIAEHVKLHFRDFSSK